jgi:hypothetical protein
MSHGGRREGAGRKKGVPNKATAEIREAARQYSDQAVKRLAQLMTKAESEAAQVAACKEILDRAWGRPTQTHANDSENPLPPLYYMGVPILTDDADADDQRPDLSSR